MAQKQQLEEKLAEECGPTLHAHTHTHTLLHRHVNQSPSMLSFSLIALTHPPVSKLIPVQLQSMLASI